MSGLPAKTRAQQAAEIRQALHEKVRLADTLAAIINGEPLVELDYEGAPVGYARPTTGDRLQAIRIVTERLVPSLKATEVEHVGAGTTFRFETKVQIPSAGEDVQVIEGDVEDVTVKLEDKE